MRNSKVLILRRGTSEGDSTTKPTTGITSENIISYVTQISANFPGAFVKVRDVALVRKSGMSVAIIIDVRIAARTLLDSGVTIFAYNPMSDSSVPGKLISSKLPIYNQANVFHYERDADNNLIFTNLSRTAEIQEANIFTAPLIANAANKVCNGLFSGPFSQYYSGDSPFQIERSYTDLGVKYELSPTNSFRQQMEESVTSNLDIVMSMTL